jgi:deoxyribodipyrimidine photolyase-related protein
LLIGSGDDAETGGFRGNLAGVQISHSVRWTENFLPPKIKHPIVEEVKKLVDKHFPLHPGETSNYWIPVTRKDSLTWFKQYMKERFDHFGDYQDALDERSPFLYHSLISPLINIGFLTPDEVVEIATEKVSENNLSNVEGFVRQIIGWREFLRGIYQNFDEREQTSNFFQHQNKLTNHWYQGTTGIPPLDYAIKKAQTWGYCHHIERLMVIGNIMLLLEVHPQEVYRWFMEMFVDSSDWVMGPNVFGMSQFSDGGLFATKPYICSSNYLLKMSHYKKDPEWTEGLDGLYWMFIDKNRKFFEKNPRLGMMVKLLDKMPKEKRVELFKQAEKLKSKIVKTPKNN